MHRELSLNSTDVLPTHVGFNSVLVNELKNPPLSRRPEATSPGSRYRIDDYASYRPDGMIFDAR